MANARGTEMRDVSRYTRIDRLDKASIDKSAIAESRVICQFRGADVLRAFTRSLVASITSQGDDPPLLLSLSRAVLGVHVDATYDET
jgi:hypothetical protein